jgi:undecaprenyl-diphosphatase
MGLDFQVEQWINGPAGHTPVLDQVMIGAALAAEWVFVAVVVVWFAYGWWRRSAPDREGALAALLAAAVGLGINRVISMAWARPRPFIAHSGLVHLLVTHSADPSFPSDHAVGAVAVAAVLVGYHRRWGIAALVFAALVCYARVYVGDHYPSDVLAGAAIGAVLAVLLLTVARSVAVLERRIVDTLVPLRALPPPGGAREPASPPT